jgi:hypothetical protein
MLILKTRSRKTDVGLMPRIVIAAAAILCFSAVNILSANVSSTSSNLFFDVYGDGTQEMTLNSTGLGIGTIPSTNLHVMGNAVVTGTLAIGITSTTSNLHINGSWALSPITVSSNIEIGQKSSLYLVNSSSDNLYLTLPYAANVNGRVLSIKKTSPLNSVFISGNDLIDHHHQLELNATSTTYPSLKIMSSANQWYIIQSSSNVLGKNPSSHSNLMIWYDAADLSSLTLDGSGNVSAWKDKSGNIRDLAQSTTDLRPKYVIKAFRDHGSVRFDGVDDYLGSTYTAGGNMNLSVFIVTKYNNSITYDGSVYRTLISLGPPVLAEIGIFSIYQRTSAISDLTANSYGEVSRNISTTFDTDTSYTLATAILSGVADGDPSSATMEGFLNGVSVGTDSEIGLTSGNILPLWIGGCSSNSTRRFDGDICEVLIYNRALSATEREDVEAYLRLKWNP